MKKLLSFILILCLLLSCAACATKQPAAGNDPTSAPTSAPTDPEPTDPEPTDPAPTDPEPTDPEPTDPEPTDPEPTDPEPTDPEPTPDPVPPSSWDSFTFQLGSKTFQFPCTCQDFYDAGYGFESTFGVADMNATVDGHTRVIGSPNVVIDDHNSFGITLLNNSALPVTALECALEDITFEFLQSGDEFFTPTSLDKNMLVLPGGVTGASSIEDIKSAWGEPDSFANVDNGTYYIYKTVLNAVETEISFYFWTITDEETGKTGNYLQIEISQDLPLLNDMPEGENVNVYTMVPESWNTPYLWAWYDSTNDIPVFSSWPGMAMTADGKFYVGQVPDWANAVIISAKGTPQTEDILVEAGKEVWVVVHNDGTTNYTLFYSEPTDADLAAAGY